MKINTSRRGALAGVGIAALALSEPRLALGQDSTGPAIRIGHLPIEVCAELFYAKELGFFKKAGLNVELQEFTSPGATASALLGNSIDVAILDTVGVLIAHSRNIPIVFLASGELFDEHAPNYGTIVPADSPIRSARDLSGTFAVSSLNGIATLGIQTWVDRNGGDSKRMKFVESPVPLMPDLVARHTVDGAVPVEPFIHIALNKGLRALLPHNGLAKSYETSGCVATRQWAEAHSAEAAALTRVLYDAGRWSNRNREASIPILSKYLRLSPSIILGMSRGVFSESTNLSVVQPVIDAAVTYGMIPKRFPASEIYYSS